MNDVCPYFGICGGCLYQDLSADDYRNLKVNFIKNALRGAGIEHPLLPIIEIGMHTRRRATFAYQNGVLGFNKAQSHQIVAIKSCLSLTPELEALLPALADLVRHLSGSGDLAVLMSDWGADITVIPKREKAKRFNKKTVPKNPLRDVVFLETVTAFCQEHRVARFVYDEEILFQTCVLPFPPNVFMQPSVQGQEALINLVLKACESSQKVLDLFCGLGTFTKPLQKAGKRVMGMDITIQSIDALVRAGVPAQMRDLFRAPVLSSELNDYDTVVMDPARAGAKEQSVQLARSDVKNVVMVSCNPVTFARDCRILLDGGYILQWICPVDQFTYTNHIELVALLMRA